MEKPVLCAVAELCGFATEARLGETLRATVTLRKQLAKKLPEVMDSLGCVVVHPVTTNRDGKFKIFQCIALADSWITGNRMPSAEHIQALRGFFHIGEGDVQPINEEPQWWMDLLNPCWHYNYRREDLRQYRPWDLQARAAK